MIVCRSRSHIPTKFAFRIHKCVWFIHQLNNNNDFLDFTLAESLVDERCIYRSVNCMQSSPKHAHPESGEFWDFGVQDERDTLHFEVVPIPTYIYTCLEYTHTVAVWAIPVGYHQCQRQIYLGWSSLPVAKLCKTPFEKFVGTVCI